MTGCLGKAASPGSRIIVRPGVACVSLIKPKGEPNLLLLPNTLSYTSSLSAHIFSFVLSESWFPLFGDQTGWDGRMSRAPVSNFWRSGDSDLAISNTGRAKPMT